VRVLDRVPTPDPLFDRSEPNPGSSDAPYRLYNIGNDHPVELGAFIEIIENAVGRKAIKNMLPMQAADVVATHADIEDLRQAVGFAPTTPLKEGVERFVAWYRTYYGGAGSHGSLVKQGEVLKAASL
jgi:UDP-glucuronate 4-epimerase